MTIPVITIDGPTASGKGTIAQIIARKLGFHYLDSGALYRLTALSVIRSGINPDDATRVADIARNLPCRFEQDRIFLGTDDVTDAIRTEEVGNMASRIAVLPQTRQALTGLQTNFKTLPGLVADGRDMGTVIFPEAVLKIFLTASVEVRAERRYRQLIEKGIPASIDVLRRDLVERDKRDSERKEAPLIPAEDAIRLDTSNMDIDETAMHVLDLFARKKQNTFLVP